MLSEDEGVKAIQELMGWAGLSEPEEVSRANWKKFSDEDKIKTESAYKSMLKMKERGYEKITDYTLGRVHHINN